MATTKNESADYHKNASAEFDKASKHHQEAAKQHEAGNPEKAGHHATMARGYQANGNQASNKAAKSHAKEYGDKK